uniref:Mitochondrial inner membrane protein COX18 (inferred by orthology to a human protein) n=1 Tax=Strongyloides venezuelensis TaxID=75913 RepID=A0A0K0F9J9_STRVS
MLLNRTLNSCLFRKLKIAPSSFVCANNVFEGKRNSSTLPSFLNDMVQYSSSCNITTSIQHCMEGLHTMSGLGWGTTFVASAFLLRAILSPTHVYAEKLFANNVNLTNYIRMKHLKDISEMFKIKLGFNKDNNKLELMTDNKKIIAVTEEHIKENTQEGIFVNKLFPTRIFFLKIATIPIWVYSSFAVRNILTGISIPAIPGSLWIDNLMLPDPYFVLPICVGLLSFLNMYSQKLVFPNQDSMITKVNDFLLAFATIIAVRFMMDLPACISLYWMSVSISGIIEIALIRSPMFKSLVGIKKLPTDSKYPLVNLFMRRS